METIRISTDREAISSWKFTQSLSPELISNRTADLSPNRTKVKEMDELPDLPFERMLSYLSLADRLRSRAVSRRWYHKINCFKVNILCYSDRPIGRIQEKSRWVSGAFAENFISSTRFFTTYRQTILSSLKHLRLCDLSLNMENRTAFTRTLKSFGQLEQLDIVGAKWSSTKTFKLVLPMLSSIHLEELTGIKTLTLNAPTLKNVKLVDRSYSRLRLNIVHGESVERLITTGLEHVEVANLKNLKYLYIRYLLQERESKLLSGLKQLKEIHLQSNYRVSELFELKQRSGRADLKIYLSGLLLNGPDDPAIKALRYSSHYLSGKWLVCLAENPSRLADEIPFHRGLEYSAIEDVAPGLEVDLLKRCTDLNQIKVNRVRKVQRFLDFLKNHENISDLWFSDYQQDLFDRLPEHCAFQRLKIDHQPSDLAFLFRLKHLIDLRVSWAISGRFVRKAFKELPVLSSFTFLTYSTLFHVTIRTGNRKRFSVSGVSGVGKTKTFSELNVAIKFIFGEKSKA